MKKPIASHAAWFAAGGFAAAVLIAGVAHAITDTVFQYSTPKTGYLSLAPFAFGTASNNVSYDITPNYMSSSEVGDVCMLAGVNLPHRATISQVTAWFASSSGHAKVTLWRSPVDTFDEEVIAQQDDVDTSGMLKPISVKVRHLETVDNAHYLYELMGCFRSPDLFHGARITYTYTDAGD